MNPIRLLYFALATSNCVLAAESRETFDRSTQLPHGWQSGITGQGNAKWEVIPEPSAPSKPNVLRQSGEATFAWAAKMDAAIKDGFVEVKINPIGASRKWSTLRVEFSGKLFTVLFNGERLFEVEDETFKDAGGVGVWTKADSVTLFDDFVFGGKQ